MRYVLALLLVLISVVPVLADSTVQSVVLQSAQISKVTISATNPVTKIAASAVTNTDAFYIVPSEQHSIGVTATVTGAVSVTLVAQYSDDDGVTWAPFQPTVSTVFVLSDTVPSGRSALSLPVCKALRFTLSSDASRAISYTSVKLGRY